MVILAQKVYCIAVRSTAGTMDTTIVALGRLIDEHCEPVSSLLAERARTFNCTLCAIACWLAETCRGLLFNQRNEINLVKKASIEGHNITPTFGVICVMSVILQICQILHILHILHTLQLVRGWGNRFHRDILPSSELINLPSIKHASKSHRYPVEIQI